MITPTRDYLLIERDDPEEITVGGIIIPDTAQNPALTGTVKSIGVKGSKNVKVGDKVLFTKYVAHKVGETEVIAKDGDIIGILNGNLLTVFGDIVIATPQEENELIIQAIKYADPPTKATVNYTGSEADEIEVGDTILYYKDTGESFKWQNKTYLAFRQKDIRAVLA